VNPHHTKDPNCVSTRAVVVQSFSQTSDGEEDSMKKSLWPRWTTRNVNIHRKYFIDASKRRIVHAEDTATDSASANRDDYLWFRHRPIRLQKRELHIPRYRASDEEHVGMTRRGNELDSETFDVVDRIVQSDNLQFASVA
jgi:hypothetical protein